MIFGIAVIILHVVFGGGVIDVVIGKATVGVVVIRLAVVGRIGVIRDVVVVPFGGTNESYNILIGTMIIG